MPRPGLEPGTFGFRPNALSTELPLHTHLLSFPLLQAERTATVYRVKHTTAHVTMARGTIRTPSIPRTQLIDIITSHARWARTREARFLTQHNWPFLF